MICEQITEELVRSKLFDEKTFYQQFVCDLLACKKEVIIESPFIARERMKMLMPVFEVMIDRGIEVYVITRHPSDHSKTMEVQSESIIRRFEMMGVQVFICKGNHHRKLAILDRNVLWEGSLNILSQSYSREIMRRIEDGNTALEMFDFLKLRQFI